MTAVRRWIAALAVALAASGAGAAPAEEAADPAGASGGESSFPRAEMREILAAIAATLPASMDPARFGDPSTRDRTLASLRSLSRNASVLEAHGAERGEGFRYLAAALARDAREVTSRYEAGRADEAGFLLQRLTENCLGCHARLYSDRDSPLGKRLVADMQLEGLAPPERARLEAATRQFDAALTTWEALFRSSEMSAAQLDLMGYLADYLTLCLRVKGDPARALATVQALKARPDVTDWLARDMATWTRALEELEARPLATRDGSALERARELIRQGEAAREVPADHTGLVHDIAASSVLYRFLEARPQRGRDVAEAYYLLGTVESRIDRSYWISQTDLYLETAIRMAPHEPFARDAFALLEERTVEGWTGSSGTHIPADVQKNLDELRALAAPPQG